MTTIDYSRWAGRYDQTRGASPSVLRILFEAFGEAADRSLLDIGGGTGNFAETLGDAGFKVTLCDVTTEMAVRAQDKLPHNPVIVADAQSLPFSDRSFDCALSVNVLGHVLDWHSTLREARRVIRDGPFVLKVSTQETQKANWVLEYLPQIAELSPPYHYQPEETTLEALQEAGFAHVQIGRVYYTDIVDGSFQALKWFPDALLESERAGNTAVFMRVPEDERHSAFQRMREDHKSGRLAELIANYEPLHRQYGDGTVFIARP
ncbi:MAG: class I SAM-dependent methyltransferase [Dehalococcoidia bacterium]